VSGGLSRSSNRPKLYLARAWALIWNALGGLGPHRATQSAASMAYYALFSLFPTAIVLAAGAGLFLDDAKARDDVVNFLFDQLPLADNAQGRGDIDQLVHGVTSNAGTLGLIGGVALLFSASALMGSTRGAVDAIFGGRVTRGFLRGKGIDLLLVLGVGALFILSFASTLLSQFSPDRGDGVLWVIESIFTWSGFLLPLALSVIVFGVLYTRLPVEHQRVRDVWPGILFAAIGFELLKRGFSIYLDNFANYSAVYGSLGAVIAFMVFTYAASFVFLIGAEMAALWPRVRAGEFDPGDDGDDDDGPSKSFGREVLDFAKSQVSRNPTDEHRLPRG
jgi:membrane protein